MWLVLGAAVLIFAIAIALVIASRANVVAQQAEVALLRKRLQEMASLVAAADALNSSRAELAKANEMLDVAGAARLQVIDLVRPDTASAAGPRGRIWWDRDRNRWLITLHDLKPQAVGRAYALWITTADGARLPCGRVETTDVGRATMLVDLPTDTANITTATITDESLGGADAPEGAVQLVGRLK
jgi:hypothetical protein